MTQSLGMRYTCPTCKYLIWPECKSWYAFPLHTPNILQSCGTETTSGYSWKSAANFDFLLPMAMASWLWNLCFQAFPVFSIMGTQHIINHAGFWNSVLPAYLEALYNFLLKKPPCLNIADSAEHFSEVLKIHHVIIVLPIGFVELSASHFTAPFQSVVRQHPSKHPSKGSKIASNLCSRQFRKKS